MEMKQNVLKGDAALRPGRKRGDERVSTLSNRFERLTANIEAIVIGAAILLAAIAYLVSR
jgi:hypothetical protein